MAPLTFKFIAPGSELLDKLSDFYCGVPFMDNTLHSQCFVAEFPVDEQVFPYLVYEGDVLVAFFGGLKKCNVLTISAGEEYCLLYFDFILVLNKKNDPHI